MRPRGVVRLLAGIRIKCTATDCREKFETSHQARAHAAVTGHTIEETRKYKLGVLAK